MAWSEEQGAWSQNKRAGVLCVPDPRPPEPKPCGSHSRRQPPPLASSVPFRGAFCAFLFWLPAPRSLLPAPRSLLPAPRSLLSFRMPQCGQNANEPSSSSPRPRIVPTPTFRLRLPLLALDSGRSNLLALGSRPSTLDSPVAGGVDFQLHVAEHRRGRDAQGIQAGRALGGAVARAECVAIGHRAAFGIDHDPRRRRSRPPRR